MPSDAYTTTKYKCQKNNYPPKIIDFNPDQIVKKQF